ncbi:uncharacterized protein LOC131252627 [Magnolia sinica]|uniref:uncharacterized protein LOC131252627 n=1 Tax=Magnolia sinica TaxID=86752 RepID=UPI00265A4B10|nr:uncharacterized protein LOC131252627 [Magnolia sinica]
MVCSKKEDFDGSAEGSDHENRAPEDVAEIEGSDIGSSEPSDASPESRINASQEIGLAERLRDAFRGEGDVDLLIHQDGRQNGVLQWLQALDLQVIGACRADERLKPLLKLNVSGGVDEDRLMAQLSQHFEAPEVGMLARCLCMPLVSIRVGKVIKQGTLLCPTATRGHLNLTLLPSSDLRISFTGDDGCTERLAVLSTISESSAVVIEEISADSSSRSFLVKLPEGQVSYFWCSEKSTLIGAELLTKMKDLLRGKPSLAELTGISESRLNCFAVHLRAYLLGSTSATRLDPTVLPTTSLTTASNLPELDSNTQSPSTSSKPSRARLASSHLARSHSSLYQNGLSPRSNTFKEGFPRNSSSIIRSGAREKFRRRGDSHCNSSAVDNPPIASISNTSTIQTPLSETENNKCPEHSGYCNHLPLSLPETLNGSPHPSSFSPLSYHHLPLSQVSTLRSSLLSPYYCWCPPCTSSLQYTITPNLPSNTTESVSLPPLSSLLSAGRSSSSWIPPTPPIDLADMPSLDFPSFLPDPLVRFPLPVSSFITMPSSQQIPTFTPLMSDPIVHIPVIDVCSSGQGYLVSAGPAISTTISPPLPNLVNSRIPDAESMVEKSARETLRLLISSTQSSPQLIEMLPAVLTNTDENILCIHEKKHNAMISGSRGLYSGAQDIDVVTNSVSAMGFDFLPTRSVCRSGASIINTLIEHGSSNELSDGEGDPSSLDEDQGELSH